MLKDIFTGVCLLIVIVFSALALVWLFRDFERAPSVSEQNARRFQDACISVGGKAVKSGYEWACLK